MVVQNNTLVVGDIVRPTEELHHDMHTQGMSLPEGVDGRVTYSLNGNIVVVFTDGTVLACRIHKVERVA